MNEKKNDNDQNYEWINEWKKDKNMEKKEKMNEFKKKKRIKGQNCEGKKEK